MNFKDQMTADLEVFFNTDEFAVNILYTPVDDFARAITGIPAYGKNLAAAGSSDPAMAMMSLSVMQSEVPAPQYDEKMEIDGIEWRIRRISEGDGYTWNIDLEKDKRPAFRR